MWCDAMGQVKDIKKELLEYVKMNSGDITRNDLYVVFYPDLDAVSFAMNNLETEGKVEERIRTESVGKRLFAVDEKLWRTF